MQPQQSSRIDLVELKSQIVKKIGAERSKKYFFILNRFLSQRQSKSDFDKSCFRLLGRENLPLHNQLIRAILKNASLAKTPPPIHDSGPAKSAIQMAKCSSEREDVHAQSGALLPNHSQNVPIWSNGVLPVSPRRIRSCMRDRKIRDRPSPLGPNGKVDCVTDNGDFSPCDFQRPLQHLQAVAEQPENEKAALVQRSMENPRAQSKDRTTLDRSQVFPPLGIPSCLASISGARKARPVTSSGEFGVCYNSGILSDTEMLKQRMEQIAVSQGLEGVSMDCANMLNNMLDMYLGRLIKSCVELARARAPHHDQRKQPSLKQQLTGKLVNGVWSSNHLLMQNSNGSMEAMQEQKPRCSISLLDFKVAMELNPQQLGEDWPLLLERISMHSFED